MSTDRDFRLFLIDVAVNEPAPQTTDPKEWAAWCDRKAHAAEAIRDDAWARGDLDAATAAQHLCDMGIAAARRLRGGGR